MRIAVAKPDYRLIGGFEIVLRRIEDGLRQRGHTVSWLTVDVPTLSTKPFGVDVPPDVYERSREFFTYAALAERFSQIDASRFDALISTQPPSYAVAHPHHLSLFYHHLRIFYDLSDVYTAAGFVDPELHAVSQQAVRAIDAEFFRGVKGFLAASDGVKARLRDFNGLTTNVWTWHAGTGLPADVTPAPTGPFDHALCVSRHEFPKRTELFVHAMAYLPEAPAVMVGSGGRLPWLKSVQARVSQPGVDLDRLADEDLWLCAAPNLVPTSPADSNVRLLERVSDADLAALYRDALCVVAPAYDEDYGLTALEAMTYGKPLVVCKDGGGLVSFVEDGVTGFVVEPTGAAIAQAVRRFVDHPDAAREMGRRGRDVASRYTWDNGIAEIEAALERVCG